LWIIAAEGLACSLIVRLPVQGCDIGASYLDRGNDIVPNTAIRQAGIVSGKGLVHSSVLIMLIQGHSRGWPRGYPDEAHVISTEWNDNPLAGRYKIVSIVIGGHPVATCFESVLAVLTIVIGVY